MSDSTLLVLIILTMKPITLLIVLLTVADCQLINLLMGDESIIIA